MKANGNKNLMTSVFYNYIMVSSLLGVFLLKSKFNCSPAPVQPNSNAIYFLLYEDDLGYIKSKRNQVLLLCPQMRVTQHTVVIHYLIIWKMWVGKIKPPNFSIILLSCFVKINE